MLRLCWLSTNNTTTSALQTITLQPNNQKWWELRNHFLCAYRRDLSILITFDQEVASFFFATQRLCCFHANDSITSTLNTPTMPSIDGIVWYLKNHFFKHVRSDFSILTTFEPRVKKFYFAELRLCITLSQSKTFSTSGKKIAHAVLKTW